MYVEIVPLDGELAKWRAAIRVVAAGKAKGALARALSRAGDSAFGKVRTAVGEQMGVKRANVTKAMSKIIAKPDDLQYTIEGRGKHFSLIDSKGVRIRWITRTVGNGWGGSRTVRLQRVSAAGWNFPRDFPGAFIARGSAGTKKGAGAQHIFARRGDARFPLKKLWGPAVRREMVRGKALATFEKIVGEVLPRRVAHEMSRILP